MLEVEGSRQSDFSDEIRSLYYQRSHICLWLGVVFFSLFAILDYACCQPLFNRFFTYRLIFVVFLLCCLQLLRLSMFSSYPAQIMYVVMLAGTFVISLMTIELGGFYSGYYVGILLMIAGAISVLPVRISSGIFTGFSMYVVYFLTVLLGTGDFSSEHLAYAVNNSFFFFSIIGVTAVQSFDEGRVLVSELHAKKSIQKIRKKLTAYTDDLEETVQKRLAALQETDLRYQDLYNSLLDLVVLTDDAGRIQKINRYCTVMLNSQPVEVEGRALQDVLAGADEFSEWFELIRRQLQKGSPVRGLQLHLQVAGRQKISVELSGNCVDMQDGQKYYQLVLRDITTIKKMESELLESERLIGTSRQAAIFGLAKLAECRDDDTGAHLLRMQSYTRILCEELANHNELKSIVTREFIEDILHSAVLHDIGKVGIPDSILLKPAALTCEEFELMKKHCIFGSETLSAANREDDSVSFLLLGREIARSHHERWDGRGYPDGLSGNDIPLAARIIALADVYDALTSSRVYKPAYNHEVSKAIIIKESGGQFDPQIVYAFLRREQEFKEARMQLVLQQN